MEALFCTLDREVEKSFEKSYSETSQRAVDIDFLINAISSADATDLAKLCNHLFPTPLVDYPTTLSATSSLATQLLRRLYDQDFEILSTAAPSTALSQEVLRASLDLAVRLALQDRFQADLACRIVADAEIAYRFVIDPNYLLDFL